MTEEEKKEMIDALNEYLKQPLNDYLKDVNKRIDEAIAKLPKSGDTSGLIKRFEDLKKETEEVLNKMAEGATKLQEAIGKLASSLEETMKKQGIMSDELRSLGGKLIKPPDKDPVLDVKKEMAVSMFDLFED